MKVFTVPQIRAWDAYTIAHEPISSLQLMERASSAFVKWFCERFDDRRPIFIVCGMGNNGGDGLVISRLLLHKGYSVQVIIVRLSVQGSADFEANLIRVSPLTSVQWVSHQRDLPDFAQNAIVIDALLGSGLSRPAQGLVAEIIQRINASPVTVVAVDIASGLFADLANAASDAIIQPDYTISFQCPKLAFVQPQLADYVGEWHVVPIGLAADYAESTPSPYHFTTTTLIHSFGIANRRKKYAHKGSFGHALLIGGSYGKIGAIVLSSKACLRSGVGLLTVQTPRCGYDILQTSLPEAMALPDWHWMVNTAVPDIEGYSAIGIGPGLGKDPLTLSLLQTLLPKLRQPTVFDADALNLMSEHRELLPLLPPNAILTPHPKEFQRLLGRAWKDDFEKLSLLQSFAQQYQVIVCLKGAHTAVALPDGTIYFNSTGNPGMATGGSGDVLTGIITGLLTQGIPPHQAAIFGVYQHGAAGDRAANKCTQPALIASDIINEMGW